MRTCCTCPDQAGLHTGDGAGPASDLFQAECVGHLVQAGLRSEPVGSTG